jgi:hypothetical protein
MHVVLIGNAFAFKGQFVHDLDIGRIRDRDGVEGCETERAGRGI